MNKRVLQNYEQLAQQTGLKFDVQSGVLYGQRSDYGVIVYAADSRYPYFLTVAVSAKRSGGAISKQESKIFVKEHKPVRGLNQTGYLITMTIDNTVKITKLAEKLNEGLNALVSFLRTNGFQNCCQTCGSTEETDSCVSGTAYMHLCGSCFTTMQQNRSINSSNEKMKNENIVGGLVGALIGSLLGMLCIIIISQLGYVAAISGVVMAVCTMKGYELLAGRLSNKGIIISVILMILMTYVGNQLDWAVLIIREMEFDFSTAYRSVPVFLESGIIESGIYWGNLALVYIFVLVGAVPTVYNTLKNRRKEDVFCRLGEDNLKL